MSSDATARRGIRFLASVLAIVVSASICVRIGWEVILAVNIRLSPNVPWYPLAAGLLILTLWAFLRRRWMPRGLLPRTPVTVPLAVCIGSGVVACVALNFLLTIFSPTLISAAGSANISGTGLAVSYTIVAPLFAAVVEEIFFRGVIQPAAENHMGAVGGVFFTSLLFVLIHLGNTLFLTQWPFYFFCSVFFGFLAWRTESLGYAIAAHVAVNLVGNFFVVWHGSFDATYLRGIRGIVLLGAAVPAVVTAVLAGRRGVMEKYRSIASGPQVRS